MNIEQLEEGKKLLAKINQLEMKRDRSVWDHKTLEYNGSTLYGFLNRTTLDTISAIIIADLNNQIDDLKKRFEEL